MPTAPAARPPRRRRTDALGRHYANAADPEGGQERGRKYKHKTPPGAANSAIYRTAETESFFARCAALGPAFTRARVLRDLVAKHGEALLRAYDKAAAKTSQAT